MNEFENENREDREQDQDTERRESHSFIWFAIGCFFLFLTVATVIWKVQFGLQREKGPASVLLESATQRKLGEVARLINQDYLYDIDQTLLADYLFKGIAAGLDDPYAAYYTREELESVFQSHQGEYYGIGVTIEQDRETGILTIVHISEGSPAWEAGLQAGDVMIAIDKTDLSDLDLNVVSDMIQEKTDPFDLTVEHPDGRGTETVRIVCGEVEITTIDYKMQDPQMGYMKIAGFTFNSVDQFKEAAKDLQEQGMQYLMVDLRNNPGGLLPVVCDILDEILPEGLIVYTEDKYGNREEFKADGKRTLDCPVAVLINHNSASASEIFAGAIQDYGIGPVIGEKSYGKGVVQTTYSLSDGSAFKMTNEKYYTPKGQEIEGNGITPDYESALTEEREDAEDAELDLAYTYFLTWVEQQNSDQES